MKERMDKLVATAAGLTRSEARGAIRAGRVSVNGTVVTNSSEKADVNAVLTLDGVVLLYQKYIYLMMNKPLGVVSASRSSDEPTVVDLVPEKLRRAGLFPAGRLDKDTTGFVLITDDGAFAHDILSPKKHITKTYLATLEHPVTAQDAEAFEQGVLLSDGTTCLSASVTMVGADPPVAQVILREGRYHQVKRMFAALGNRVTALKRTHMGGLPLDPALVPGECRQLTAEELGRIRERTE